MSGEQPGRRRGWHRTNPNAAAQDVVFHVVLARPYSLSFLPSSLLQSI